MKKQKAIEKAMDRGCVYACAELIRLGGDARDARAILSNWGIRSMVDARASGASECDLQVVKEVFDE